MTRGQSAVLPLLLALGTVVGAQETGTPAQSEEPAAKLEVTDLDIQGVHVVDESAVRRALVTRESSWLPWGQRHYFDEQAFAQDVKRVEAFYEERGYPYARVIDSSIEMRRNGVALRIVVDEGQPVRVADLAFTGVERLSADTLRALKEAAPLKPGEPLDADAARQIAQMVAGALGDLGYAYAHVDARKIALTPNSARLEFHADPGELGAFGPIEIVGNMSIEDDVIRRELAYRPGQAFRTSLLQETQHRLLLLGLFESVLVEVTEPDRPVVDVPTRITVKETDLNKFGYSFGYGTEEQLSAEVQWRHLNLFGGGRAGTVRGRWSSIDRGGEAVFRQPYLFTSKLSLQLAGYVWQQDEPVYTVLSRGGSAGVSYQLGRLNRVTGTYLHQFESNTIELDPSQDDLPGPAGAFGAGLANVSQEGLLAAVRMDATRDTTVEVENPQSGYRAFARVEHSGGWLPGSFDYDAVFTTASVYRRTGVAVLAGQAQLGSIMTAREADVPFSKRYFLGGAESLRGWGRLEVSPLSSAGQPIGGRSVIVFNGEVRFPVKGPLSGVAFIDAGNVWADSWNVHLDDLRSDIGVGARVNSPFGLVRVDLGYQLTPIDGLRVDGEVRDRRWRIHVSLGHIF